jgi:thiol:disulfide interchange protein DsbD
MRQIFASLGAAVALAAATPSAQGGIDPVTWALAVQPAGATVAPGETISLALTATIDEGWHLYSLKLEPGGPVPTAITVPDGQLFMAAGDIGEPVPSSSFDTNFSKVLEYHETKAVFTVPVKSGSTATPGRQTVKVSANYQTCNDRLCLPARQVVVSTEVQIVPKPPQ